MTAWGMASLRALCAVFALALWNLGVCLLSPLWSFMLSYLFKLQTCDVCLFFYTEYNVVTFTRYTVYTVPRAANAVPPRPASAQPQRATRNTARIQ